MARVLGSGVDARPRLLSVIGLLSGALLLTALLGWQAHRAAASHLATAHNALREYSALAADEWIRRSLGQIGYYGYFQLANALKSPTGGAANWPALRERERAAALARQFFEFAPDAGTWTADGDDPHGALEARVRALPAAAGDDDAPFLVRHGEAAQPTLIAVRAEVGGQTLWRGFAVERNALEAWFRQVFDDKALLPSSLADGAVDNDALYVQVDAPDGTTLFRAGERYDSRFLSNKAFGDDYQGILQGFAVTISIDPAVAPSLVIGGLPRSRLPLLIGLIALSAGLIAAAMWLMRREQALIGLRSDFVAQVSHELRTPLTQIRMFAETLLLERTRDPDERRRALHIIDREARRLTHLTDNVLQFSRAGNGDTPYRRDTALAPIVQEVCDDFVAAHDNANATLALELDPTVRAPLDADALRQILLNLLDNAAKYGPRGQTIRVAVTLSGEYARLSVHDEGPGIPAAERERVWDDYERLERERRGAVAGTGIGLSVVRALTAAHAGRCFVDPDASGGARFVVDLPRTVAA